MANDPIALPPELRAGDSLQRLVTLPAFPASQGWELRYTFVGQGGTFTVTAAADNDNHKIDAASVATAGWTPGVYRVQAYVTNAPHRHTVAAFTTRVLPNLAAATGNVDTRSHARKVVDAIEAWLERRAPTTASFQIDGRRVDNIPIADLLKLLDRYRGIVRNEDRIESGGAPARMLARF